MKINELKEKMAVEMPMMVTMATSGVTNNGAPYLSITFKDSSGTIDGKYWDIKEEQAKLVKPGEILDVRADVIMYRGNLQLKISSVEPLDRDSFDLSDFIQGSPVPIEQLRETIQDAIASIDNFDIKAIVSALYQKYDHEIFNSPAAARLHHEFVGGLATHTAGMLKLANAILELYPALNSDLLIAGILLHDIGKIRELHAGAVTEYTLEGKLLGHISISQTMVQETADELGIEGEAVVLLRHMILAHHGQYEFGSPVLPCLLEAEALHQIDDFDARMNMITKALDTVKPGEFTAKMFMLDNRSFYKPKED